MRIKALIAASMTTALLAGGALAEAKIYPYPSKENYCPAGLQPVTISGVICCGTPNTHTSYHAMMRHAPQSKPRAVRKAVQCTVGQKGCD